MPNDNKLAHLVVPHIAMWRHLLLKALSTATASAVIQDELTALKEIEQQAQADLIDQPVPAPKDEVSCLLDLFQVAALRHDEHACQVIRRDIAKVVRHGVKP